jgi:hypothetical protein
MTGSLKGGPVRNCRQGVGHLDPGIRRDERWRKVIYARTCSSQLALDISLRRETVRSNSKAPAPVG